MAPPAIWERQWLISIWIGGSGNRPGPPFGRTTRNVANYVECAVNLLDELAVEECVKQLLEKFGKIDIAVMTAGGFAMGDLSDTGISELEHQYRLNFETAYNLTKPLYEHMKLNHGGRLFCGFRPGT